MARSSLLRAALVASIVALASSQTLPDCGQVCYNDLRAKFGSLDCATNSEACLCTKQDFHYGLRDCAMQLCGADVASQVMTYATSVCATAAPGVTPTARPTTSAATSRPSPTSPSTAATPTTAATSRTTPTPSTFSSSIIPSATESAVPTDTEAPAPPAEPEASSGGLSNGAKAGLGVGISVAVIAIGFLILYVILRRRGNQSWQISNPLPGSGGRTYADDQQRFHIEKKNSELDVKSKKYEDMVQRQAPRGAP